MQDKGSNLIETRRRNRALLKNLIFRTPDATRTQMAEILHLTKPTITTSVNEMLQEGILEEIPLPEDKLKQASGRHPTSIAFRADAGLAIGVELGPYTTEAVLMDLKGNIRTAVSEQPPNVSYNIMLEQLCAMIRMLLPKDTGHLLGAGIGLPGFINNEQGLIRKTPRARWSGYPLAADLEARLGIPVMIDNNVRLRALEQVMNLQNAGSDTFAYFYISKGVACPLMVGGQILSGHSYGSGELGHALMASDSTTGTFLSVDDLASERALMERCQQDLLKGDAPELREILNKYGKFDLDNLLELERKQVPAITRNFKETLHYAGIALANVVNLINPELVIVDAYMMQEPMNRDYLLEAAHKNFYGLNEEEVKVCFVPFDQSRGAKGAAYYVILKKFLEV